MSVMDWFISMFNKDTNTLELDMVTGELSGEVFYKNLAIQACVNLISNVISKGEFLTYEKGKEVRRENYYLLNVEPNQNKTSSKFWRDVIHKLVFENECLVIQEGGMFYVADEFETLRYAFKENIYKNIVVENYKLKNTYLEHEVFHFELHNEKIKTILDGLYKSYSKLIEASTTHYKRSKAKRGILKLPTNFAQTEKSQKELQDLLGKRFKRYFEAEGGAVLPLSGGMEYEEQQSVGGVQTGQEGGDVRKFIDDIFDFVCMAFQIPPQLVKGNIVETDEAINSLLMFCINPLSELITDEINRKLYRKERYLERTYVKLDTTRVKSVNIKDIAGSLDILLRTGSYTINDCLKALGKEEISDEAGNIRFITKNYEALETHLKGGD